MANRTYIDDRSRRWDSKFEWRIANWCDNNGVGYSAQPRSFSYRTPVKGGTCVACEGTDVVQDRSYTPDFLLDGSAYYIEAKGFFRPGARALLQRFITQRRDVPLRFIFQANKSLPLKRTPDYLDWAAYYKCVALVWSDKVGLTPWLE